MLNNILKKSQFRLRKIVIEAANFPRILFYKIISSCPVCGHSPKLFQPMLCIGKGKISFGNNVVIGIFPSPHFLTGLCHIEARKFDASITIGSGTVINNDVTMIAEGEAIAIGNDCLIGPRCTIFDSDFHGLSPDKRMDPAAIGRAAV